MLLRSAAQVFPAHAPWALLLRLRLVIFQDLVDNPQPGSQLRTLHWFLARISRRRQILQHLPNGLPRQAELMRRLPDAHATLYTSQVSHKTVGLPPARGTPFRRPQCILKECKAKPPMFRPTLPTPRPIAKPSSASFVSSAGKFSRGTRKPWNTACRATSGTASPRSPSPARSNTFLSTR